MFTVAHSCKFRPCCLCVCSLQAAVDRSHVREDCNTTVEVQAGRVSVVLTNQSDQANYGMSVSFISEYHVSS